MTNHLKSSAWKVYSKDDRQIWYYRHVRCWVMRVVDTQGNQVNYADYTPDKELAKAFLNGGYDAMFELAAKRRNDLKLTLQHD